ncbi:hypothetical protein [Sphingomonas sp.]|uniref:capsular polysaccharide export protein, LipB/KpsS family n=1 Tax=Sphingomonas sp. TaxID=28214 RepID=UPI0031E11C9C
MSFIDGIKRAVGWNPLAWIGSAGRMRGVVRDYLAATPRREDGITVCVVVPPWLGTPVPWFALAVGLLLAGNGAKVSFVVDDQRFGPGAARYRFVLGRIRKVMALVARHFPVFHLSHCAPVESNAELEAEIDRLAALNTIWAMRGETVEAGRAEHELAGRGQIAAAQGRIAAFVRDHRFDLLFVPGGVFGNSGIWLRHARAAGMRVATFDTGGYETAMLAADGLACQLEDVPRAFAAIKADVAADPAVREAVIAYGRNEIAKRKAGSDNFESQIKNSGAGGEELRGGILIALNSSWDAAALGLQLVYPGNADWIVGTVRYLLDHSDATVIVRQHPAERLSFAATSDDYRALLQRNFGDHPRLVFIAAEDPINSYALLERVKAVVVHSSTIGIEATAYGRPVVTGSRAYYSGLGFVWRADNAERYHALLDDAVAGRLEVTEAMREDAMLCFYVTQLCNWVFSRFNPADYVKWSREPLAHWGAQPPVQRMVRSLLDNVAVAELNHRARIADGANPA